MGTAAPFEMWGLNFDESGIAGPGGATPAKPLGLVHLASIRRGGEMLQERHVFSGSRNEVRLAAVTAAIAILTRQVA